MVAKWGAQRAWKMRQIRTALEFKKKWETNPEGMEKRRRAGVKSNAAKWAKSREGWIRYWGRMKDELTPEAAREVAERFLRQQRGKWRTRKHPRLARSVLKRVSKLGVWKFDELRGLYINPRMEAERQRERAEREEAERRAEIAAADARRRREEAEAKAKAEREEAERRATEAARPAPAGWDDFIPAGDKGPLLAHLRFLGILDEDEGLADTPALMAERLILLSAREPQRMARNIEMGRRLWDAELARYAEAVLCAD